MTQSIPADLTRISDLDSPWAEPIPGTRLEAVRSAGLALKNRLKMDGPCVSVRTFSVATLPYPTQFGFGGAARSRSPYLFIRNRMQLVQVHVGDEQRVVNILVNPSDPERTTDGAPYIQHLTGRWHGLAVKYVAKKRRHVSRALASVGLAPEDIDYITYDHLHVQDVRGLLGTTRPESGGASPTRPELPNARLLVQTGELAAFEKAHPLQRKWYIADGLRDVDPRKIIPLDGDYTIGRGFAILRTPGHTEGNHSLVVHTDRGLWTISENGIAVDAYAPACSQIPGLARYARREKVEVVLNANTRENTLSQYTSMVLEKTIADRVPDRPEFPQHFCSSELVASPISRRLKPTYSHGTIIHGTVSERTGKVAERAAA